MKAVTTVIGAVAPVAIFMLLMIAMLDALEYESTGKCEQCVLLTFGER